MLWFELFLLLLAVMEAFPREATCMRLPDIHWNSTNPIFRIDNTDHIIDVNKGNIPFEYDQVNIICPVYTPGTHEEDAEKYIIYNVSKEEYDSCRITNPTPRIIAICDKPYKVMYFTITFRSFTPQPGGLEFQPGQDYYFISTSSKDDLHRRIGGRCSTHNMKVVFKVCCRPEDVQNQTTTPRYVSSPAISPNDFILSTAQPTFRHPFMTPPRPTNYKDFDLTKATTKKSVDSINNQNEVMKNPLPFNGSPGRTHAISSLSLRLLVTLWLIFHLR